MPLLSTGPNAGSYLAFNPNCQEPDCPVVQYLYIALFDKSDKALVNDYEEICSCSHRGPTIRLQGHSISSLRISSQKNPARSMPPSKKNGTASLRATKWYSKAPFPLTPSKGKSSRRWGRMAASTSRSRAQQNILGSFPILTREVQR